MEIKSQVISLIKEASQKQNLNDEDLLNIDYLDKGLLDSFQMVGFITKLEELFKIKFSLNHLTSKEFPRSVTGKIQKNKLRDMFISGGNKLK